jgi:hypothetical protein
VYAVGRPRGQTEGRRTWDGPPPHQKIKLMIHDILTEIKDYTASVHHGTLTCDLAACPCCDGVPAKGFSRHDSRKRTFRVVAASLVEKVLSALTRWRCPLCNRTFTYYPRFAAPHKRYVTEAIMDRSYRYVEDDAATYRSVVREESTVRGYTTAVGYVPWDDGRADDRQLAHSTVHRWLTWLGSLRETLRMAFNLIKARAADSMVFRQVFPVSARKYRSDERRLCLGACRRLFRADRECRRLSFGPIIPSFGTACGWT